MMRINFRRVFILSGIFALVISYAARWVGMITSPEDRSGTDYICAYSATRIYQLYGADHVYDPTLQQIFQQDVVGFSLAPQQVLLYQHLPYFLPLLAMITTEDYETSFILWTAILLVILLLTSLLFVKVLGKAGYSRQDLFLAGAGAFLFFPPFLSLLLGQDTIFVLLGTAIWMWGILNKKDAIAGLGLCLVTIRPQVALILAIPLLFRKPRIFFWFCFGCLVLFLYVYFLIGWNGMMDWIDLLLISSQGEFYGMHLEDMPSLSGILHRWALGLGANNIQWISMVGYLAAALGLSFYFWKSRSFGEKQLGLSILCSLVFVPYLHYHDVAILLIPIFCLIRGLHEYEIGKPGNLVLLPLVITFLIVISFITFPIKYPILYIIMFGLGYALLHPDRIRILGRRILQR